jgi:hypothetical protein
MPGHIASDCRKLLSKNKGDKIEIKKRISTKENIKQKSQWNVICQICLADGHTALVCEYVDKVLAEHEKTRSQLTKIARETKLENQPIIICTRCGAQNHEAIDCYTRYCTKCGNRKHLEPKCGFTLKGKACYRCDTYKHSFKQCPDRSIIQPTEGNRKLVKRKSTELRNQSTSPITRQNSNRKDSIIIDKEKERVTIQTPTLCIRHVRGIYGTPKRKINRKYGSLKIKHDHRPQMCRRDLTTREIVSIPLVRATLPAMPEWNLPLYHFDIMFDTGASQSTSSEDTAKELEKRGRVIATHPATHELFSASCKRIPVDNSILLDLHYEGKLSFNDCPIYVTKTRDRRLLTVGTDLMKYWGDVTFNYENNGVCIINIPKFKIKLEAKTKTKLAEDKIKAGQCNRLTADTSESELEWYDELSDLESESESETDQEEEIKPKKRANKDKIRNEKPDKKAKMTKGETPNAITAKFGISLNKPTSEEYRDSAMFEMLNTMAEMQKSLQESNSNVTLIAKKMNTMIENQETTTNITHDNTEKINSLFRQSDSDNRRTCFDKYIQSNEGQKEVKLYNSNDEWKSTGVKRTVYETALIKPLALPLSGFGSNTNITPKTKNTKSISKQDSKIAEKPAEAESSNRITIVESELSASEQSDSQSSEKNYEIRHNFLGQRCQLPLPNTFLI